MSMLGIPVIQHRWLPDDQVILSTDPTRGGATVMLVGTMAPTDPIKLAGREARLAVRRGLADVLEWLGEPVVNEPVMARIRAMGEHPERPPWPSFQETRDAVKRAEETQG